MPTSRVGPTANRRRAPQTSVSVFRAVTKGSGCRPVEETVPSQGAALHESGVTLLELLIVMVLIAVIAAVSYPTASAGLDSLRLRSAADRVMALLNLALDRADRVQEVVEIRVSPQENAISARSADLCLNRTLAIEAPIRIASVGQASGGADPALTAETQRRFLLYPGGTPPRIIIELESKEGRKRRVSVDPLTGMLHSEVEKQ
jgi:prepilin-type N-terminal cleavage/methylation domain-containing protein